MRLLLPSLLVCAACAASPAGNPAPSVAPGASVPAPSAPAPSASAAASAPAPDEREALLARQKEVLLAVASALKMPAERLRIDGQIQPDDASSYVAVRDETPPGKGWLAALQHGATGVRVAASIGAPLARNTIVGYVDLEGEPRDDLAAAGVSIRLPRVPDRMKHPALWVRSGEAEKGSMLLLIDVSAGSFVRVVETTLAARDAGGSVAIRQIALDRGPGPVLDLVLVGEALPPPGQGGHPGPPLRFRHRWRGNAYAPE